MPRPRRYTEMVGCDLSKPHAEAFKAEIKRRKMTVSQYLRDTAVMPLIYELMQREEAHEQD